MGWRKMRSQGRGRGTWLQHFECSDLALLRTHSLYESKPLIKGEGQGERRSSCAVFCLHPSPSSSVVARRCGLLVRAERSEPQVWVCRFCLPPLPNTRANHIYVLQGTFAEFLQGPNLHQGALGHSQREEFLPRPLDLPRGCPKSNPDGNAFKVFLLAPVTVVATCHVGRSPGFPPPSMLALPHALSSFFRQYLAAPDLWKGRRTRQFPWTKSKHTHTHVYTLQVFKREFVF